MGAKFYRASDKAKKIRKRVSQTRTWARGLKWVACKYNGQQIASEGAWIRFGC